MHNSMHDSYLKLTVSACALPMPGSTDQVDPTITDLILLPRRGTECSDCGKVDKLKLKKPPQPKKCDPLCVRSLVTLEIVSCTGPQA